MNLHTLMDLTDFAANLGNPGVRLQTGGQNCDFVVKITGDLQENSASDNGFYNKFMKMQICLLGFSKQCSFVLPLFANRHWRRDK